MAQLCGISRAVALRWFLSEDLTGLAADEASPKDWRAIIYKVQLSDRLVWR